MHIDPMKLKNQSELIKDYRNNKLDIMRFFDYSPFDDYEQRVKDLKDRMFDRKQLVQVLQTINKSWKAPTSTLQNIERLLDEDSVVVIGGQQAGLLTGPMYTINKIISIIQFAKQQEKSLGIPVIPVFWIAGEDHDYDEMNHVHILKDNKMKKHALWQNDIDQKAISTIDIDEKIANEWVDRLFKELKETEHTKELYAAVKRCLDDSKTYVDFFAQVIFELFKKEGIVLVDSGDPAVRKIESKYFIKLIEKQEEISSGVFKSFEQLKHLGYSISLDVELDDAHLFYHANDERILLKRDDQGNWVGKQNEVSLTTEELLKVASDSPERLSNNVVTRPLMQELLFPTLSFIGGGGEISYWAVLKSAFHSVNIEMPPVLPRLSFTYVDQKINKLLEKHTLSALDAVNDGVDHLKINWLATQSNPPIERVVEQLKLVVEKSHQPLQTIAEDIRSDLGALANRNLDYLYAEIDYLEKRLNNELEEKYATELSVFDIINNTLHPHGGLQERVWNPLPFINEYGTQFISDLSNEVCSFKEEHFIIYL